MKKRTEKNTAKRKGIFNKLGMTYIELICALALLSLIVVMFTPMLLSSYEQLYNAGEETIKIYESKQDLEEGLARRDSNIGTKFNITLAVKNNVAVNADLLFQNINVQGRKIVSSSKDAFETVFGQLRPTLTLISPAHVNDDSTSHEILIQTRGLEFNVVEDGKFSDSYDIDPQQDSRQLPKKTIFIEVILPDKTKGGGGNVNSGGNVVSTEEMAVYNGESADQFCEVEVLTNATDTDSSSSGTSTVGLGTSTGNSDSTNVSNLTDDGKLSLKIYNSKLDFTYSPLKINVYYVNTRGKTRKVSEYIYIDPPTIMMAGETSEADYYTSAGVKEITEESTNATTGEPEQISKFILETEARTMRTSNSPYLCVGDSTTHTVLGSPKSRGIEIKNIRWIDNDRSDGINPYYVMTGTMGSIYRMYNFTSDSADLYKTAVTGEAEYAKEKQGTAYFYPNAPGAIDKIYNISTGEKICPSLWSGDKAHIFEYSSAKQRAAYGKSVNHSDGDHTWITSVDQEGKVGADMYNVFNTKAEYAYYYNGSGTGHDFRFKNNRPISYILTERGWPLRVFGMINGGDDEFDDFTKRWDTNVYQELEVKNKNYKDSHVVYAFRGPRSNYAWIFPDSKFQSDYVFASVRLKMLASYDVSLIETTNEDILTAVDYWDTANDYNESNSMAKLRTVRRGQNHDTTDRIEGTGSNINITDAIYIPTADDKDGTTFYVGSVNAFANIVQADRIDGSYVHGKLFGAYYGLDSGDRDKHYRFGYEHYRMNLLVGATTDFIVYGTDDGTGTYINKFSCQNVENRAEPQHRRYIFGEMSKYVRGEKSDIKSIPTGSTLDIRNNFFYPDHTGTWNGDSEKNIWGGSYLYLPDVEFTLGYASNRERVYTYITYDGSTKTEFMRSFERLYWRSHYGQDIEKNENMQKAFSGALLDAHTQNKALNSDGNLSSSEHRNSVNNDYYNVWFPGEMYNLSKIASKDGVTVAVGYAVAGSAYQYAHSTAPDTYTSTALGGIYNDGVLSAMVEGKDSSFVNLLYYKDNYNNNEDRDKDSFDDDWLTTNESTKNSYSAYGSYGMHTRDSVQFTAVDIVVEEKNTSTSGGTTTTTLEYWAYYGDNKGRLFRSLVATGTATATGSGDPDDENSNINVTRNIDLVSYISDEMVKDNMPRAAASNMRQILTIDNYTLDLAFSKITSIEAKDDMVIVTGERRTEIFPTECIVVGIHNADGTWSWKWLQNGSFTGNITDAVIVNGYYYFVGHEPGGKSFLGAISLDTLKDAANGSTLSTAKIEGEQTGYNDVVSYNKDEVLWTYVTNGDVLNTIAGRAAS